MARIRSRGACCVEWHRCSKGRGHAICNRAAPWTVALLLAGWLWLEPGSPEQPQAAFCAQGKGRHQSRTLLSAEDSPAFGRLRRPQAAGPRSRRAEPPEAAGSGPSDLAEVPGGVRLSSPLKSGLNLLKSLLGSGNLALPSAIAVFSGSRKAVVPAIGLALIFNLLSAYGFVLIARVCEATKTNSYQDAWSTTVSSGSSWMPAASVLLKTWLACVSYLMIVGDCTSMVLLPLGAPAWLAGRTPVIIGFTTFLLLPLCCLKSMAPLAKFSVVGILSAFYCLFVIAFRCISGSYAGGPLLAAAPHAPKFTAFAGNALMTAATPASSVLIATLAYAYTNHYSSPQFYAELEPDSHGSRASRMRKVTYTAFLGGWVFFSIVMACGFLTFGTSSQGMILNNYALIDQLAVPARLALSVSMLASFPIIFASFKAGLVTAVGSTAERFQQSRPIAFTVMLLLTIVPTALYIRDLGVLAALAGAVLASFIVYIAPSLMAICARRRGLLSSSGGPGASLERALQLTLVPSGVVLAIVGAVQALPA